MTESDGIEEGAGGSVNMSLMMASSAANTAAELRTRQLQEAARRSAQEAEQLQRRLEAERAAARAELEAQARRPGPLSISDATRTWELAELWAHELPDMRNQIAERIQRDLGVDPRTFGDEAAATTAVVTSTVHAERADVVGRAGGAQLDADVVPWDSRERRSQDAQAMLDKGVPPEAVNAAMTADVANATPPTSATRGRAASKPAAHGRQPAKTQTPKLQR